MFQFRRFPPYTYLIQCMVPEYCSGGFPHSEIPGSMDVCSSPRLIAAYHVFHRLPVPRHSPCALFSLTVFLAFDSPICQQDLNKIVVNNFLCISFRSYYSVFKVHPGLSPRLPSASPKCIRTPNHQKQIAYTRFRSYKRAQLSRLSFSFEKVVGSSLESRNALFAYTSYKRAFRASRLRSPLVGSSGLEPPTSRLSGARSNHLSYEPIWWR